MVIILIVLHIVVCGLFVLVPDEQGMPFFGLIGMALLLGGSYLEGDNLLDQWWGRLTPSQSVLRHCVHVLFPPVTPTTPTTIPVGVFEGAGDQRPRRERSG